MSMSATSMYDEALDAKFRRWTKGTDITYTGPEETRRLFEVIADKQSDRQLKLPMICLRRNSGYNVDLYGKRPLTFTAFKCNVNDQKGKIVNAIPVTISYQVDVYTRYFEEADDYMRNLLFNIINYPRLEIEIKYYNADIQHMANILPSQQVMDNSSSTAERLFPGQFTRLSYSFSIDDAYLWDVRLMKGYSIVDGDLHIMTIKSDGVEDIVEELDYGDEEDLDGISIRSTDT